MNQSTYNRITFACSALIVGAMLAQLTHCGPFEPSDPLPVMSYELDGTWCTTATPDEICLTVRNSHPDMPGSSARYFWSSSTCQEIGTLTGGLEFWPDTASRLCLAPEYDIYSASAQFTPAGLRIELDQASNNVRASTRDYPRLTLDMRYVSYQERSR